MKRTQLISIAVLHISAALAPVMAAPTTHPWPMVNGDAQNTGQSRYVAPRTKPVVAWQVNLGASSYSRPVISSGGIMYVTTGDGKVFAVSDTGHIEWTFSAGSPIYASAAIGGDGTIYVPSVDKTLYALKPDGTVKWTFNTGGDNFVSPLLGTDDSVFVCSRGGFYRLAASGQQMYKAQLPTSSRLPVSFAVASNNEVVLNLSGANDQIVRLRNNGTTAWTWAPDHANEPSGQVSIGSNGRVYVQHHYTDQSLLAFNAATGALLDQVVLGTNDSFGFGLGLDNSIYATTSAGIEHYSPTFSLLWKAPPTSYQVGGPVLDSVGTGLMGEGQTGYDMIAFDTATGATLWELTAPNPLNSFNSPVIGPTGNLFVTSFSSDGTKGFLYGLVVPEPSSFVLAEIGAVSLLLLAACRRLRHWV